VGVGGARGINGKEAGSLEVREGSKAGSLWGRGEKIGMARIGMIWWENGSR